MNPTNYAHCNHNEKGMTFPRIRGELLNHEPMGKKPHVTFPCLIQLPPLKKKLLLLVGAVMAGSGVWPDCQSFPTRTLHQRVDLTMASKNDHRHHSSGLSTLSTTMPFFP